MARVTSKGQLTLPSELRKRLGIRAGDTVTFDVIDETAVLKRNTSTVESVRGIIPTPPHMVGRDIDEMIEEATANHAEWLMRQERGLPE